MSAPAPTAFTFVTRDSIVLFEWLTTTALLAWAMLRPRTMRVVARPFKEALRALAGRRKVAMLVAVLLPVLLRLALLPWMQVPTPAIIEEFSNLLQADTFAHGRLANPPHPMAAHFETMQVMQHPTYGSFRPPAQGALLAVGMKLGHPWIAVVLAVGVTAAALFWAMEAWLPATWALLGALLWAIRLGVFSAEMNSYWGGTLGVLAGALAVGGAGRLLRMSHRVPVRRAVFAALALGLGLALMFHTRAYEGGLLGLVLLIALLIWWLRSEKASLKVRNLAAATLFVIGVVLVTWTAYYDYRVTGRATTAPYVIGRQTQNVAPPFLFIEPAKAHEYPSPEMKKFYLGWEMMSYVQQQNVHGYLWWLRWRWVDTWLWYVRPELTIALLFLPFVCRDRRLRLILIAMLVGIIGFLPETWTLHYYIAPFGVLILLLLLQGLRHLRVLGRRTRTGEAMVAACVLSVAITFLSLMVLRTRDIHVDGEYVGWWAAPEYRLQDRADVVKLLDSTPGKHLVIVHYTPGHDIHREWVYNGADPDGSKIVFSRDYGEVRNQELFDYYKDRQVWIAMPDSEPTKLERLK